MLMTTTSNLEGHVIIKYLGLVAGQAAIAPIEMRDFAAFIRREGGGRHPGFEQLILETRHAAMMSLEGQAKELGANAIIGVTFDFASLASDGLVLMTVAGTAVQAEDKRNL
jgi:uncharacterized protein YbjQ (UPF0145 family)